MGATYAALLLGSQFFADDFLYLQLGARDALTIPWLFEPSYGHLAPVFRLLHVLIAREGGVSWPFAAGVLAILVGLMYTAILWFARLLLGRGPAAIVVALVCASAIPTLRTTMWLASGVQVIGGAFCMTLCIAGFIAYLKSDKRWHLAVSVGALALGLLWQERPILTIGYLILIRYLFFTPERPWGWPRVRSEARIWAPYLVVDAAYLWYRLFVFESEPAPGNLGDGVTLFTSGFLRSYLPSLVGVRQSLDSDWVEPSTVLGAIVLLAAFLYVLATRRGAWRCVAFLVATYGANIVVQAAGRLGVPGTDPVWISRDLQYFVDPYLATVFALCLAWTLPRRETPLISARVSAIAMTVVAVPVALSTALHWVDVVKVNHQSYSHRYLNQALTDLAHTGNVDLISLKVPEAVSPPFVARFTDQERFFTIDADLRRQFRDASPRKVVITADGNLVPAHPVTLGWASPAATDAGPACISGPAGTELRLEVPSGARADEQVGFVRITYSSPAAVAVRITSGPGADNDWPVRLPAGEDRSVIQRLDHTPTDQLRITTLRRAENLCVSSVWLGMIAVDTIDGCRVIDHHGAPTATAARCDEEWGNLPTAVGAED
ncbi:hypothetical protein GCM10022263_43480 [Nocardioides daeguensis]|uniref:Glycosyltransferase RgtA/B/C/D-like domain-containing protein n=1 Tax=Nocardioides daeguensis TaxID=908359 RepID=A0ABP6WHZ5_9ACTN